MGSCSKLQLALAREFPSLAAGQTGGQGHGLVRCPLPPLDCAPRRGFLATRGIFLFLNSPTTRKHRRAAIALAPVLDAG